jgi:hypothetical protein
MVEPWSVIIPIFGPFAAVAVVLWFVFRYLKPKVDDADERLRKELDELRADNRRLAEEREEAKDAVIAAFGDIGNAFELFARDVRDLVMAELLGHEEKASTRFVSLVARLDEHKDEIIQKLSDHISDLQRRN